MRGGRLTEIPEIFCPVGTGFRLLAEFGTPVWHAISAYPLRLIKFFALWARYFALRRNFGSLRGARQGGAGYGASPPSRPPLHPPRSTPKEGFQLSLCYEGNAAIAAGASFPRCAHSGDLPPRRVNARERFRFESKAASAMIEDSSEVLKTAL